jgi:GNAT superfamily N-acetyltransferase
MRVVQLPEDRLEEALDALVDAFVNPPNNLTEYIFARPDGDCAPGLRALFRHFLDTSILLGWPLAGVELDGELVGVLIGSGIGKPEWPAALHESRERMIAAMTPTEFRRCEEYVQGVKPYYPTEPHYGVIVLGVRPAFQGQGIAQALLAWVAAVSADDPRSTGVYLDTPEPFLEAFYRRRGYQTLTKVEVAPGVPLWCMFQPKLG